MSREQKLDILIVDDDEGHVELVRRNLRRAGITNSVIALANGAAALDYVFRRGEHASRGNGHLIVLLDINMPGGIDGIEVLRRVKVDPEKRKIPIIMLTTTDNPREIEACYELGCNVYMTKPVDPVQFMEAVNRLGLFVSIVRVPADEESA